MNRVFAFASAVGDRINPVAVKEFRQAVQSRWVTAVFMLFLLLNLCIIGGYLMLSPNAATSIDGGRNIFMFLEAVLFFTCLGFIPLFTGARLSIERNDTNIDLFFITTITPGAIVRGKYFSAMALTLLIYSACMPFMILTYLLRGIDLPTIFTVLALGYMYSAFVNALGIFAGSISGSWLLRGLVAAGMLFMLLYMAVSFIVMVNVSLNFGMGMVITGDLWKGVTTGLFIEALLIGVLYVFAVANLSPKPANRMFVPRIYLTLAWLAAGLVAAIWAVAVSEEVPILMWVVFSTAAFCIMAVVSLGERDAWTTRVRRVIPKNILARLLAFLFYSGAAGGIIWSTILFWTTILGGYLFFACSSLHSSELREFCGNAVMVFGYVLCYCLTTAFICKVLLKNINMPNLSVLAMFLGVLVSLVPLVVAFLVAANGGRDMLPWYVIGSPMVLAMDDSAAISAAEPFVVVWLAIVVLASLPWLVAQWQRFTPLETACDVNVVETGESTESMENAESLQPIE